MSYLVNLSECIVDGNPVEVGRPRWLRGRALGASMLFETGVVACLLLWPLMKTAVLPPLRLAAPLPVFHRALRSNPSPRRRERTSPRQPSILHGPALHQPLRLPPRVDANTDSEPPALFDLPMQIARDGLGAKIGGDGTQLTNLVRPDTKPRSSGPIVVSTGVMAALLIHRLQPEYPAPARMIHLAGTVELRAIIGMDGFVRNLEVVSGNPILAAAAVEAVRQWRYQPTRLDGKPIEVETVITVRFQMQ